MVLHSTHLMKYLHKNAKVAVVGNGPFHREWGDFIDGCDIVIRFNTFCIKKYERYVGSKTTIWCLGSNHEKICLKHNSYLHQHNVKIKQIWVVQRHYTDPRKLSPMFYNMAKNRKVVLSVLQSDEQYTGREVGVKFPSTGVVGLGRALLEFAGLPIYLFGFNGFRESSKLHYYSPSMKRESQHHNGSKETAYVWSKIVEGTVIDLEGAVTDLRPIPLL